MHQRKHTRKPNISKFHIVSAVLFIAAFVMTTWATVSMFGEIASAKENKNESTVLVENCAGRQEVLDNQKSISHVGRNDIRVQEEEVSHSPKSIDMEAYKASIEKIRERKSIYVLANILPEDNANIESTADSEETRSAEEDKNDETDVESNETNNAETTEKSDSEEAPEDYEIVVSSDSIEDDEAPNDQVEESESYAEDETAEDQNEESTNQDDDSSEEQSEKGWNYDGWAPDYTQGLYIENAYGSYDSPSIYRLQGWTGRCIAYDNGLNDGPSGKETYYIGDIYAVAQKMWNMGYTGEFWCRSDGVYMLGDYVMVAANLSLRPFGTIIKTSVGMGIVCDTGGFAKLDPTKLDIATAWN